MPTGCSTASAPITGLHGEIKGSRMDLVERALFFELFDRFGARAQIRVLRGDLLPPSDRHSDFDIYVGLLKQLTRDWLADREVVPNFVVDEGRYSALVLEQVRLNITAMLANVGSARMEDSARCPGIQLADVVANSFYNLAIHSGRAHRIAVIVEPFVRSHVLRSRPLDHLDAPGSKNPAMQDIAGLLKRETGLTDQAVVIGAQIVIARRRRGSKAQRLSRARQRADLVRRIVVVDLHLLHRADQIELEVFGKDGLVGDLAQRDDRILVTVAVDRQLGATGNGARPLSGQKDEIETIGNLVDAIFDSDARHAWLLESVKCAGKCDPLSADSRKVNEKRGWQAPSFRPW